jgi:hypothetical protein
MKERSIKEVGRKINRDTNKETRGKRKKQLKERVQG